MALRDRLHDLLVEQLSDLETGPLSDTKFFSAKEETDGMLSLFLSATDQSFPDASVDIPQLVDAILPLLQEASA